MANPCYHPSIEGAQHGAKSLTQFLDYAKKSGAAGAQPSNFMLENGSGGFKPAKEIKDAFARAKLSLDGVSAHCPFWVHTTAWTGSKTVRPFVPADVAKKSTDEVEKWAEDYCLRLLDLCAQLNVRIVPMFWGTAFGWELATGYPWGFWKGGDYDLLKEGQERFVKKTAKLRKHAKSLGIYLAHEIHGGTAAMTADDFNMLVECCDGDKVLAVNADPSHCWEGEDFETRFRKVGARVEIDELEPSVVTQRVGSGNFDTAVLSRGNDPSPSSGIMQSWTLGGFGGSNFGRYYNPEFERLVDLAISSPTKERARGLWRAAITTLNADAPGIFLYSLQSMAAVHQRIENVQIRSDSWAALLRTWRIPPDRLIDRDRVER